MEPGGTIEDVYPLRFGRGNQKTSPIEYDVRGNSVEMCVYARFCGAHGKRLYDCRAAKGREGACCAETRAVGELICEGIEKHLRLPNDGVPYPRGGDYDFTPGVGGITLSAKVVPAQKGRASIRFAVLDGALLYPACLNFYMLWRFNTGKTIFFPLADSRNGHLYAPEGKYGIGRVMAHEVLHAAGLDDAYADKRFNRPAVDFTDELAPGGGMIMKDFGDICVNDLELMLEAASSGRIQGYADWHGLRLLPFLPFPRVRKSKAIRFGAGR